MKEIELKDAIKIAQIISKAPDERLPLIMSVLEKADFAADGLAEIEEWKAFKEQASIIDLTDFINSLFEKFPQKISVGQTVIIPSEFNNFCKEKKLRPILVKRLLAEKGYIEAVSNDGKTEYSKPVYIDGKTQRRIVITKNQ